MTALAYDFTAEEVAKLLQMQDELNTYIDPKWKIQGFNWVLAIIDECMEIHGHLGWKWWKKDYQVGLTEQNRKQVQLEVIDILHFGLSIEAEKDYDQKQLVELLNYEKIKQQTVYVTNDLLYYLPKTTSVMSYWRDLAHSVGLTKQEILETYIQKFVLNKFRQDHGYKTGTYDKIWQELDESGDSIDYEDNEVLSAMVGTMALIGEDTTDEHLLYAGLEQHYNSRLNQ